ncbi:MAG: FHA domain-containing protein [Planctomycetota bacterium]|nr:FHA domain-containing protein [Planctomycetota bacterium]MDA0932202.1 FHA domain-containing protein [Planctomycetota bacterium]MDA1222388.1 FHA domain-containing protein [Planctomycetota bacterium]
MTSAGIRQNETPSTHPARASYRLRIESDADSRSVSLDRPRTVIGRALDCDVVLADPTVSRRHAVLEFEDGRISFRDLGGTNVCQVDGRPSSGGLLHPGAVLLVGATRLTLEAEPERRARTVAPIERTERMLQRAPPEPKVDLLGAEEVLAAVTPPPTDNRDLVVAVAGHLLQAALRLTHRRSGAIVVARSPVRVIASVPADPALLNLPGEVTEGFDAPVCLAPDPTDPARGERLIVPIDLDAGAALIVGDPESGALSSEAALRLLAVLAPWTKRWLEDAERRAKELRELAQTRFQQSFAARTAQTSVRLGALRHQIAEAATASAPVLLLGEEGCEAEEIALLYHERSASPAGPFVRCYARLLPPQRIATELGLGQEVEEGAGSCATRARNGTLFVDCPEALPPALQRRLAEVLAQAESPRAEGFRVVLSVMPNAKGGLPSLEPSLVKLLESYLMARIPPLRTSPQDIAHLIEVILGDLGPRTDGSQRQLSAEAQRTLTAYHWPGNVRQLTRALETAAARAGDAEIDARHLPTEVQDPSSRSIRVQPLREVERDHILRALAMCGGHKTRAARKLGISASTLHEKLRRYAHGE